MLHHLHPDLAVDLIDAAVLPLPAEGQVTLGGLEAITRRLAGSAVRWCGLVRHDPEARWYTRLVRTDAIEVWALGWWPGQGTPVHDHGGALGALTVVGGTLAEDVYDEDWQPAGRRHLSVGTAASFTTDHVHAVSAVGSGPATSIHAYSPPALPLRYTPTGELVGAGVLP
ncbi:MAG TPA: cysteine dioxygenase family protein [Mycobacteriales bacterium]|nr:cysteine dioxygenase family protein [Mycobacteriales bacterium]